jgi:hypothetical protein
MLTSTANAKFAYGAENLDLITGIDLDQEGEHSKTPKKLFPCLQQSLSTG